MLISGYFFYPPPLFHSRGGNHRIVTGHTWSHYDSKTFRRNYVRIGLLLCWPTRRLGRDQTMSQLWLCLPELWKPAQHCWCWLIRLLVLRRSSALVRRQPSDRDSLGSGGGVTSTDGLRSTVASCVEVRRCVRDTACAKLSQFTAIAEVDWYSRSRSRTA